MVIIKLPNEEFAHAWVWTNTVLCTNKQFIPPPENDGSYVDGSGRVTCPECLKMIAMGKEINYQSSGYVTYLP